MAAKQIIRDRKMLTNEIIVERAVYLLLIDFADDVVRLTGGDR